MNDNVILGLLPFFFVAVWCFAMWTTAQFSGWRALQRRYPDRLDQPVERMRFQSGNMGKFLGTGANFGNCLTFDVCRSGLRVSVLFIFALFQKPFFVPWSDISAIERRRFFFRGVELQFGPPGDAKVLWIYRKAFDRIAAAGPLRLTA